MYFSWFLGLGPSRLQGAPGGARGGPRGPERLFFQFFLISCFAWSRVRKNAFFKILGFGAPSAPRGPCGPESPGAPKNFSNSFKKVVWHYQKCKKNAFFMILWCGAPGPPPGPFGSLGAPGVQSGSPCVKCGIFHSGIVYSFIWKWFWLKKSKGA